MKRCACTFVVLTLLSCTRDTSVSPPAEEPAPVANVAAPVAPEPTPSVPAPVEAEEALLPGTITVLAFDGLKIPLQELARQFEARHPGVKVQVQVSGLVDAIRRLGTDQSVDILITEGASAMEVARPADVVDVDTIRVVTHLELTATVAPSKKEILTDAQGLRRLGVRLGLSDPRLSTGGRAAQRLVRRLGLDKTVKQRVLPGGVKTALSSDVVDVFVGWGRVDSDLPVMTLPASARELLPITAAVTKRSQLPQTAIAFLEWSRSNEAAALWKRSGTVPTLPLHAPIVASILPAVLPGPRYWSNALAVDNRILLVGGRVGDEDLNSLVWFDPAKTMCKTASARLPTGRHGVAAVMTSNNEVVIAGGLSVDVPESEVFVYDRPADRLDAQNVRLPVAVGRMAVASFDEALVFFGGRGEKGQLKDTVQRVFLGESRVDVLDTRLPSPRSDMAVAHVGRNRVLLVGGNTKQGPTAEILEFTTDTHVIRRLAARLDRPFSDWTSVPVDGDWMAFGGQRFGGVSDTVVELSQDGTASLMAQRLPYSVRGAAVVAFDGRVYVLGGITPTRVEHRIVRWPW